MRSQNLTILKGTEMSLSCVQCFLCLVSSAINVSIFHITQMAGYLLDRPLAQNCQAGLLVSTQVADKLMNGVVLRMESCNTSEENSHKKEDTLSP